MALALLLIDLQNDYFSGGTMELTGAEVAVANAAALLQAFRQCGRPVIHVQHIAKRPGATFFLPNSPGAQIHPAVLPARGEPVVTKHFPSSFRETDLLQKLRELKVSALAVAGMMTHMCVDTTVRAAADLGFECTLAHDACATKDLQLGGSSVGASQVQLAYLAALNGAFAKVLSTSEIVEALRSGA